MQVRSQALPKTSKATSSVRCVAEVFVEAPLKGWHVGLRYVHLHVSDVCRSLVCKLMLWCDTCARQLKPVLHTQVHHSSLLPELC